MIIRLKDDSNNLVAKDILGITFDMSVGQRNDGKYIVNINESYIFDESFDSKEEAEIQLMRLVDCRNQLEEELRNY